MSSGWDSNPNITIAKNGKTVTPTAAPGQGVTGWNAPAPAPQQSGGGLWGAVSGAVHRLVVKPAQATGHYASTQAVDFGKGVGQIPTGLYSLGEAVVNPVVQDIKHGPSSKQAYAARHTLDQTGKGMVKQTVHTLENPQENLFNTLTTLLPIAGGVASGAARAGAAARAAGEASDAGAVARAGAVAKAIVKKPEMPLRTLKVPRLVSPGPELEGPARLTYEQVQLPHSEQALSRGAQALQDVLVQKGLNKLPKTGNTGRLAKYGLKRAAGSIAEGSRITGNLRAVDAARLDRAGFDSNLTKTEASVAHFLRSANVTPEEYATYAREQAAKFSNSTTKTAKQAVKQNAMLAQVADSLAQKGVLKMVDGKVDVDAAKFPKLASSSEALKVSQAVREDILRNNGLMDEETMANRKNLVARTVLGEGTDRVGQGFTSLRSTRPVAPGGPIARAVGNVIGRPQKNALNLSKQATGKSVELGNIPANTTREAAVGLRAANRFQNTTDLRGKLYDLGSDIRQSPDDVLVASPKGPLPALPDDIKVLMGKLHDTITPEEEQALGNKLQAFVQDHLLNHHPDEEVGQRAPEGRRFVNKNLVPDALKESTSPRGKGEKIADTINSAVTSATVYTKLGHLPQRLLTNATTNFVQGSLAPLELAKSVATVRKLSEKQKMELDAITGSHASQAPLIGATTVNKAVKAGKYLAGQWAKHVDAPFRVNSILFELRRIGIKTPEQIQGALDAIRDPARSGMSGSQIMKLDGAVRRSNRASIMYDGLSVAEKRNVARYVWFYPWTKGALRFAGHTAFEHPVKTAIGGQAGQAGVSTTQKELGPFPTYEAELTKLGGSKDFPIVADLSALTPYGTLSNTAMLVSHPTGAEGVGSLLNPALSGLTNLAGGEGLKGFAKGTLSPTPEYQIATAITSPKDDLGKGFAGAFPTSSKNLFGSTWQSMLARAAIGGTAMPRKINRAKLNEYAQREHQKKRTITIYSK